MDSREKLLKEVDPDFNEVLKIIFDMRTISIKCKNQTKNTNKYHNQNRAITSKFQQVLKIINNEKVGEISLFEV